MNMALVLFAFGLAAGSLAQLIQDRDEEDPQAYRLTFGCRLTDPVGRKAIVAEPVAPELPGRVRFRGTTWPAVSLEDSFQTGESVSIGAMESIVMVVEPPWEGAPGSIAEECVV